MWIDEWSRTRNLPLNHLEPIHVSDPMKAIRLVTVAFFLSMLSSCGLLQSVLKVPTGILRAAGRTVGVSSLTDEAPDPVTEEDASTEQRAED